MDDPSARISTRPNQQSDRVHYLEWRTIRALCGGAVSWRGDLIERERGGTTLQHPIREEGLPYSLFIYDEGQTPGLAHQE
jgi:hypothetical protein